VSTQRSTSMARKAEKYSATAWRQVVCDIGGLYALGVRFLSAAISECELIECGGYLRWPKQCWFRLQCWAG
jgi:hypothetical protein